MATIAVEQELLELERQYWQAIKERDVSTALRLTDDPCILSNAQGVARIDRRQLTDLMKDTPHCTLHDYQIGDDAQVRMLREDVALLAYTVHEELTVDGKAVTVAASDASVWVRSGGRWVCALHAESLAGDPFGRDKVTGSGGR